MLQLKITEDRSIQGQYIIQNNLICLTGDARPRFFESWKSFVDELCSRSGGDAREAMTVGISLSFKTEVTGTTASLQTCRGLEV